MLVQRNFHAGTKSEHGGIIAAHLTWFRLLKASWHSATAYVISQTLTAAAAALAVRGLGASAYGSVVAIIAYYGWFSLLSNYWTYALLPNLLADQSVTSSEKKRACATAMFLTVILTAFAVLIAFLTMPIFIPNISAGPLHRIAVLYALVFAFAQFRPTLDAISQSAGWLRLWSASNLIGTALPVVFLLFYLASSKAFGPFVYVLLLVAATAMSVAFSFGGFVYMLGGPRYLRPKLSLIRPFLAAGQGPWISLFSNVLITVGVKSLIATYLVSKELGFFEIVNTFCVWIISAGLSVTIPALSGWSRLVAEQDIEALRKDVRACQAATGAVLGTMALLVIVAATPILRTLYGREFGDAALLLRIAALSMPIGGLGGWYWYAAFAIGQPWRMARPNITCCVPIFGLTYVFVRFTSLGVIGALLATTIGNFVWLAVWEYEFRQALLTARENAVGDIPHLSGSRSPSDDES